MKSAKMEKKNQVKADACKDAFFLGGGTERFCKKVVNEYFVNLIP